MTGSSKNHPQGCEPQQTGEAKQQSAASSAEASFKSAGHPIKTLCWSIEPQKTLWKQKQISMPLLQNLTQALKHAKYASTFFTLYLYPNKYNFHTSWKIHNTYLFHMVNASLHSSASPHPPHLPKRQRLKKGNPLPPDRRDGSPQKAFDLWGFVLVSC